MFLTLAGSLADFIQQKSAAIAKDPYLPLAMILNITKGICFFFSMFVIILT